MTPTAAQLQAPAPAATATKRLKVMMLGLRGFPGVQGGVETHAEHLCPLLVQRHCDVEVLMRSPYLPSVPDGSTWRGVRIKSLWSPRTRGLEAVVHSVLGVFYAGLRRPDVLHVHAVGPAIITPIARLFGLRVVVTHHGPDYERQKWGPVARLVLKAGEYAGMRFANARIAISKTIGELILAKHGLPSDYIPNGVQITAIPESTAALAAFGLEPGRYVLMVSRFVAEKRHPDLIRAFAAAGLAGWKLVLVGAADHPDAYSQSLSDLVAQTPGVVLTGFQQGTRLAELLAYAGVFVLPSSHEGLPIALLEALSYGLPVVVSDIPAHRELGLDPGDYYPVGDASALAVRLRSRAVTAWTAADRDRARQWVAERYDWADIARLTRLVYERIAAG